ncbi:hypothetical protein [Sinorhizobium meliloti]|uniref:hypothetical protein n=1 Tax=Rhizobium meliloti TaxID=382 RepID=UPI000FDB7BAC|nr:hypothetical protein [Sinorhizobium meliloti]RVG88670.1 hypothetical protein CN219_03625 [Sinorhizobium meliloti]RVI39048.1 hypothetical protein CN197_02610 [Sinorhizobium meliloti]RVI46683.1 hypothetical protein CN196_09460 [Sinorhizobium meliloti]RVJ25685.1 hypothetical protein CN177_13500 [Sinorhizobium meliloti]RVK02236.1 hypothetical protein CN170_08630 [Sinorhizobium meliloti]
MVPRVIGSMTLRPGLEYIADIDFGDVRLIEYSYSGGFALIPILSGEEMRIVKDNALVSRVSVSTTVTNGEFNSFVGWTDASTGSATATVSAGELVLTGTTQDRASAKQTIAVSVGDQNKEHGLRLDVRRGPLSIRLGSTTGDDDLIPQAVLDDGVHSIAFTPTTSNVYLELFNDEARNVLVFSCQIDSAGVLVIPTPWTGDDLTDDIIRYKQNKDVLYAASGTYQQREIQRRGDTSWGVQRYKVDDGPFSASDGSISLTPSVLTGNGSLTASRNYFESTMVGRLFRLFQSGQTVDEDFTADPAEGDPIRVSGVGSARRFTWTISGTWSGTVTLQVANDDGSGNPGSWTDVFDRVSNGSSTYTDSDDNVIKFFRFAVKSGNHTSGTMETRLSYEGGSQSGIVRVIGYTSATSVAIEVLSRLYSTGATFEWDYSTWSDYDGWPASVEVFGGRLYWGQDDTVHGSVPDAFKSFDDTVEGASAPISRSVNSSSQRGILWLLGLQRLIAGTDATEISIKASSFDEPLTADSWFPVDASTRGGANIRSVKADKDGIFVQSSGTGAFRMAPDQQGFDYTSSDLMAMHEEICEGSAIVDVAVQRRPDTVVWFILANGEARALTYEPSQNVIGWSRVTTDGLFKRVAAIRGAGQDSVYFAIVRNGAQRLERLASVSECIGGAENCIADGFSRFTATAGQTTFSVPHLNGKQVTVWVDGVAVRDQNNLYTVASNQVVIPAVAEGKSVVIGLPYSGRFQSTKLAYGAAGGTALFKRKRVAQLGMYLVNTMLDGLKAGRSFAELRKFTTTKDDKAIVAGTLYEEFDADLMAVSNSWDTDSRICIEALSPYPFTAAALVLDTQTNG